MESTSGANENISLDISTNTTGLKTTEEFVTLLAASDYTPEALTWITNTEPPATSRAASVYLVLVGYLIVFIVTLFGNILVIVAISKMRFLQNAANTFVAGLAAVDMTMVFTVVIRAFQEFDPSAFTDIVSCQFKLITAVSSFLASSLTLLALSCSRYICTFMPFKAHLITASRVKMVLAFCLFYPVFIVTTTSLAFHNWNSFVPCLVFTVYPPGLLIFYAGHILLGLMGNGFCYIRILRETVRHQRAIAALNVNTESDESRNQMADTYRENIVLLKKFSIIVGIFAISLLPFCVVACIISFDPMYYLKIPSMVKALQILTLNVFVNSMINPFIYAWRFKTFRAAFRILLCRLPPHEKSRITEQFTN